MTWKCDYCGHPNLMHHTHCSNCGRAKGYKGYRASKHNGRKLSIKIDKH